MATKLSSTSEQVFVFISCSVAIAFVKAPLVIALVPVFIDFMAFMGMMLEERELQGVRGIRRVT